MDSAATALPRYRPLSAGPQARRATLAGRRQAASPDKGAAWGAAGQALRATLSRLVFEVGCPLAGAGEPVHMGAMAESALPGGDVFGLAGPGFLRGCLQRPAIGEGDLPRQVADGVDGVQMRGCFFVGLSAGEKRYAGYGRGHAGLQQTDGLFGDFLHASLL